MKRLFIIPALLISAIALFAFGGGKKECPPEGKANPKKGKHAELKPREKNLNIHINRDNAPQASDFDKGVTLKRMYDSKDDSIFNADKAAALEGYILKVSNNNMESCNCFTEDKSEYSFNVYISMNPLTKETRAADCIVAVITPYSRTLHSEWTFDYFSYKMVGKKVRISGWLIYDYLHSSLSVETNSNGTQPDRRTIWGICPTTDVVSLEPQPK
jgi:hypothetical protein